jgi:RNase P/RNase MRP subunit POP5
VYASNREIDAQSGIQVQLQLHSKFEASLGYIIVSEEEEAVLLTLTFISTLRRQKQANHCEFKAILDYIRCSGTVRDTERPYLRRNEEEEEEEEEEEAEG